MSKWDNLILWVDENTFHDLIVRICKDAEKENPVAEYKDLISYIRKITGSLFPNLIRRFFYLSELGKTATMKPHFFIALEAVNKDKVELIQQKIGEINKPTFITSIEYLEDAGSGNHPEAVLDFFHAGTKYAFYRVSEQYKLGYHNNNETKMVHCFLNQLFVPELLFYAERLGISVKQQESGMI